MSEKKVALVTGATSGIGLATAQQLASDGFDLVVHGGSNRSRLNSCVSQLSSLGIDCLGLLCDFAEHDSLTSFAADAWDWQGKVDAVINNAGVDLLTKQQELAGHEKLQLLWQVDVKATMELSQFFGTQMNELALRNEIKAGAFSITNIGWDQAWQGMAGESGILFSSSKGAIMSMTKSLAQSFAPAVRVNCVAPGWIKTGWGIGANEYWQQRACSDSLMNRWGTPEDVANVVAFLASDSANFVSGQVVNVNGGYRYDQRESR